MDVPKRYFKVLLNYKESELKAIGFILPNESSGLPLSMFSVSVDEVEQLTNLDFFYLIQDEIEDRLESTVNWNNRDN